MGSRKNTNWLAVWDMYGLESLFNVDDAKKIHDDYEKQVVWSELKGEQLQSRRPNPIPIQYILLRARVNSHRNYEIYSFTSINLTEKDIRLWFAESPQEAANWIRENGEKLFSDYSKRTRVIS
jgi:hypothetical protein